LGVEVIGCRPIWLSTVVEVTIEGGIPTRRGLRPRSAGARAAAVLGALGAAALLASCSSEPAGTASPGTPSQLSVANGRYVRAVALDDGALTITPAPASMRPVGSAPAMETLLWSTAQLQSSESQDLGFGLVSVRSPIGPGGPIHDLPAWIGISSDARIASSCPEFDERTTHPPLPKLPSAGEMAVIVGDPTGSPAVVYRAQSAPCGSLIKASISPAEQLLSLPWSQVAPISDGQVTISFEVPACGSSTGWSVGGTWKARVIAVSAIKLIDASSVSCVPARATTMSIGLPPGEEPGAPPVLTPQTTAVLHGPTGPQRAVSGSYWTSR
jgi:hypothetical protein